jgi:alpha-beta hydrolase superfamily lysophospholipase
LDDDHELNEAGDKFYKIDSHKLLFHIIDEWNEGKIEIDDVVLTREYIETSGVQTRLCHTEISHKHNAPKATMAIFHGLGQNSDLFVEFGIQFAMNGYKVEFIDFRGYGWSGGMRAEHTLIEMQHDIVALLKEADPELPLFFFAHSMGCIITAAFLMNNPNLNISGVILQAPLTANPTHVKIDTFRLMLVKMLGESLPELIISPRINPSSVTKKAVVLKWFLTNRKLVPIIGTRQAAWMAQYMYHFRYNSRFFKYPVLIHLGGDDKIVNNDITKHFYDKLGSEDKQLFEYEGAYHELQYEDCKREVLKNTLDWINFRIKEGNAEKLGSIDFDTIKVAFLKKKAPFKHWKALITAIVVAYYFIGYVLMVSKFINKNRHEMIALWPCSLYRKFFGRK